MSGGRRAEGASPLARKRNVRGVVVTPVGFLFKLLGPLRIPFPAHLVFFVVGLMGFSAH
ncbi:hypothetical protein [Sinomonas susongensis]|uniref:hypothetical protein n=1 Tax=Sinomonas susongensis TaxID=1324851 RepID=UPI001485E515|nr:hypothetical protein [Sinomonas susongensis]